MPFDHEFGLFLDSGDGTGPVWRASYHELEEAKRQAQKLASEEGREFFVYSFKDYSEVARSYPARRQSSH